nr:RNA-directed DNA polymerase, eukaryota, reverse transcriptase zinc-binding domain protein [Tanacetum cinerariifolium]
MLSVVFFLKERFDSPCSYGLMLEGEFSNKLRADQSIDLESNVTFEEIKKAVWDCGIDKSPGPDGFTFGFYRRYWDIIKKDVADAVSFFFISGRVMGLKVFIGNFTYKCNFMTLEDTTSIIDHHLGVVFGKPFARNTGLVYEQEDGTVTFKN